MYIFRVNSKSNRRLRLSYRQLGMSQHTKRFKKLSGISRSFSKLLCMSLKDYNGLKSISADKATVKTKYLERGGSVYNG